jgi:hypothetical protein
MISELDIQLALRNRFLTLQVVASGALSLQALATGGTAGKSAIKRTVGSWLDDGFAVGMEVTPAGFVKAANLVPLAVVDVTATHLTVNEVLVNEAAAAGRSVTCLMPSQHALENEELEVDPFKPYFIEQYIPGVPEERGVGPDVPIYLNPIWRVLFYFPENSGIGVKRYAEKARALYPPGLVLHAAGQDIARVDWNPGPQCGELVPDRPGWSVQPVIVPVWAQTTTN